MITFTEYAPNHQTLEPLTRLKVYGIRMSFFIKTDIEDRFSVSYNALFTELSNALANRYSVTEPHCDDDDGYLLIKRADFVTGLSLKIKSLHPLSFYVTFQYPYGKDLKSKDLPCRELKSMQEIIEKCFSDHQFYIKD